MVPTSLGRSLLDFAIKNFPDLFAFEFTATMEKRLDLIAEGKEPWKKVLETTWNSYKDRLSVLQSSGTSGTSLSLASTFIVAGQSRVITALPSDAAVTRLPKHLSQAAARALHPNLQV